MGDVITRFRLETNQWDSALRDASQGLANLTNQLTLAGNDFNKFAQKDVEVARALGQVESGATNLKDKLRDLVSAYNNVAKAYNNLTKDQQQSDFGKAMASSLDQLQGRITQTKNELYNMSDSTKQAGGSLGSLNDIFGMSITKLAGWGTAIAAAKGALDVAKDAFFVSEQNIDSWGQAVEAGQAVYESFLTSINSGDISGFLSRIGQITNAAIEAYNALDQLNTQKTIQSPQVAIKQAEISRMRTMLQTGRYVAPADGRSTGGMKTGDVLTKEQIANISKNLEQALNEVATITRSQVKTASTAIDKLYAEQAAVLGVSKQRFQQATSSWENFQAAMDNANKYERWKKENTTYTTQTTSTGAVIRTASYDDSKNPYRDWAWVSRFKDDGERFQRLIQEIQNRESAKSTLYSQYGQAYRRINRAEGVNPYGNVGGGSAADKTNTELKQNEASIAKLTEQYQKLATEAKTADDAQRAGISTRMNEIQGEIKLLSDRNAELKRFAAEAQSMKVSVGISSSLPELNEQLKQLQQAQSQALNNADWTAYGKQIEQVQAQIEAFKGKWKEGLQATFRINAEVPEEKTVVFKADDTDVLEKARQISGVHIDDKTLTVTALTEDAEVALRNLDGMKPQPKFLTVTALTAEAEESIRKMGAEQIGDKTFRITAEMANTITQLQDVNAYKIDDKDVAVNAETQAAIDKLKEIDGVTFDTKTMTVTANTAEAYNKCQELFKDIEGTTVEFTVVPKIDLEAEFPDLDIVEPYVSALENAKSSIREKLAGEILSVDQATFNTILQDAVRNGIDSLDPVLQEMQEKMAEGMDIPDKAWQKIIDEYNELRQKIGEEPIDIDLKTGSEITSKGKGTGQQSQSMQSLISNVTTITRSLQDLGIEVPQGFSNVINIMNIIQTLMSTLGSMSGMAGGGLFNNIPILGPVFSFFGSILGFSGGGIVPHAAAGAYIGGNHYSGDLTPVWANAGELILNKSSQNNLASILNAAENGGGIGRTEATIESDTIRIVLQNGAQAKGQTIGQYLGII